MLIQILSPISIITRAGWYQENNDDTILFQSSQYHERSQISFVHTSKTLKCYLSYVESLSTKLCEHLPQVKALIVDWL